MELPLRWHTHRGPLEGRRPLLPPGEAHLWFFSLERPFPRHEALVAALPGEERRGPGPGSRRKPGHLPLSRVFLRAVLGFYLGLPPEKLTFRYSPRGKPALDLPGTGGTPFFNLSHGGGAALLALTREMEVGVDLEKVRPLKHFQRLWDRCLSPREQESISPERSREGALDLFFRYWTHKEAYLKATGQGLVFPPSRVEFDPSPPGETLGLLKVNGREVPPGRWTFYSLGPAPGYTGALALPGADWKLRAWHWVPR